MIVKLSQICNMQSGGTPRKGSSEYYGGDIPWIKISDFKDSSNGIITETEETITQEGLQSINNRLFEKGTLLLAMYGSVGKTAFTGIQASCNQAILGITAKDENQLNLKYLKYWLDLNQGGLVHQGRGVTLNNISLNIVKKQEIDLPDLETQNKIVAILDKASALVQKRQLTIDLLDELLRAQFLEMFGNPTSSKKFKLTTLASYLEKVQIGPFGSQLHRADYVPNEVPLINPINIVDNKVKPDYEITIKKSKYDSLPNYHLKTGDLIMARRGEMGRCGIITEKENGWFCGTGSLYLRPKDLNKSMFLLHCIINRATIEYLNHNAKGVTMKNLNKSIIAGIPIIDCPENIILTFNEIVIKYDAIRLRILDNLREIQSLFYSILQRAFSGKLNLDVSVELDALLEEIDLQKTENDLFSIITNEEYLLSLVKRLNNQQFESQELYDKAKHAAFQMLKDEERLEQEYDEQTKSLKLLVK